MFEKKTRSVTFSQFLLFDTTKIFSFHLVIFTNKHPFSVYVPRRLSLCDGQCLAITCHSSNRGYLSAARAARSVHCRSRDLWPRPSRAGFCNGSFWWPSPARSIRFKELKEVYECFLSFTNFLVMIFFEIKVLISPLSNVIAGDLISFLIVTFYVD